MSGKFTHSQLPMAFWADENDSAVKGFDGFVKASYKDWLFHTIGTTIRSTGSKR